ncbi:MAG: hypothetical protein NT031_17960, partial [Planctomycetota bacterium]|nr:hypothetical protein [Planctomycetota bacterium]
GRGRGSECNVRQGKRMRERGMGRSDWEYTPRGGKEGRREGGREGTASLKRAVRGREGGEVQPRERGCDGLALSLTGGDKDGVRRNGIARPAMGGALGEEE